MLYIDERSIGKPVGSARHRAAHRMLWPVGTSRAANIRICRRPGAKLQATTRVQNRLIWAALSGWKHPKSAPLGGVFTWLRSAGGG
jgi:hypothetical protein